MSGGGGELADRDVEGLERYPRTEKVLTMLVEGGGRETLRQRVRDVLSTGNLSQLQNLVPNHDCGGIILVESRRLALSIISLMIAQAGVGYGGRSPPARTHSRPQTQPQQSSRSCTIVV
eukprot:1099423-Rhodomonas_salina.2